MDFSVENLIGFLYRSRLLPADDIKALQQRWQNEGGAQAGQVAAFTRWLVNRNYLTDYQAGLLAKGQVDDFFLNDYKILERIGRGRMAGVYKAVHRLGQVVAIKVLPPSRAANPQLLARFEREARLSVRLKHPNIVRSFQLGRARNLNYLVMEYLEGETVEDVLARRRRLPPDEAVRLIHQALLGLQHLQEKGMVHRDLKPSNLMLVPAPVRGTGETTSRSTVKILDIGLAREMYDENTPAERNDQLTDHGMLLGTPDYMSPEQARDPRHSDIRADIYSLGCVLYHFLSGQVPFPDRNLIRQLTRHATETPAPLREFNPEIPEGLEQIVNWMMAKKPAERYATPLRAAQAMEVFLMAGNEPAPAEEAPQMRSFLTWLERENANSVVEEPVEEPPLAAAVTAETHTPAQTVTPQAAPAPVAAPAGLPAADPAPPAPGIDPAPSRGDRKRRRTKEVKEAEQAKPAPASPGMKDTMEAPILPPAPVGWRRLLPAQLSRRDWILLGSGVALGVGSCVLGEVLVLIGRWMFSGNGPRE